MHGNFSSPHTKPVQGILLANVVAAHNRAVIVHFDIAVLCQAVAAWPCLASAGHQRRCLIVQYDLWNT